MFIYKINSLGWVIKQISTQVGKQERSNGNSNNNNDYSNSIKENSFTNENNCQTPKKQFSLITLPYKGQQGEKAIKSFRTSLHKSLSNNIETKMVYTGTKLDSNFQVKDKTKFDYEHDLVDYV